jgi:hypothetical protein
MYLLAVAMASPAGTPLASILVAMWAAVLPTLPTDRRLCFLKLAAVGYGITRPFGGSSGASTSGSGGGDLDGDLLEG